MIVQMSFICPELFESVPNGQYDLPDGGSIKLCVERCAANHGAALPEEWEDRVLFLKDNKPAHADDEVADGSDIIVLRRIIGG